MTLSPKEILNNWRKQLTAAVDSGDLATAKSLMERTLSSDEENNPLRIAVKMKCQTAILTIVRMMREIEDLDAQAIAHRLVLTKCPIKCVVPQSNVEIIEHMIRLGSNVNETSWCTTALHSAVEGGDARLRLVELLLDNGAKVLTPDNHGLTPLHRCFEARRSQEVARLLVSRGARVDNSCLVGAINTDQTLETVELLVGAGADVRASDEVGRTPMYYAACQNRRDLIDYFLDLGADPNGLNDFREETVVFAFDRMSLELLRYLVLVCGVNIKSRILGDLEWTVLRLTYKFPFTKFAELPRKNKDELVRKTRFCMVSDLDDTFWYERHVVSSTDNGMLLDLVLEQVAVCEFMNVPVGVLKARRLYDSSFCRSYIGACKSELAEMMGLRVYGNLTLFNMLTDSDASMRLHVQNEELVAAFRRVCEEEVFLIYRDLVTERFKNFLYLHEIREKAMEVLCRTLHGVVDGLIARVIAKHLSIRSLFKLSKFYEG